MAQGIQVVWSNKAIRLLADVAIHLSEHIGKQKANQFQQELINFIDLHLSQFPESASLCRFIRLQERGFRCLVYQKKYIVIYRFEDNTVKVAGVISARRNPKSFNFLFK